MFDALPISVRGTFDRSGPEDDIPGFCRSRADWGSSAENVGMLGGTVPTIVGRCMLVFKLEDGVVVEEVLQIRHRIVPGNYLRRTDLFIPDGSRAFTLRW